MNNKDRLENLRKQIRGIFSKSVQVAQRPAQPDLDGFTVFRTPEDLEKYYSTALNTLKHKKTSIKDKQIDHIIGRWAEAQMLSICPEIVEETNPDIQNDVLQAIIRAEKSLSNLTQQMNNPATGILAAEKILMDLQDSIIAQP